MRKLFIFTTLVFLSFWFDQWFIEVAHILTKTIIGEIAIVLTDTGTITYIIMALYFFVRKKKFTIILLTISGLIATFELGTFIKLLTQVPRPYAGDALFLTLESASGFSFPSNHAALIFCLLAFSVYVFKEQKKPLFALAILLALTRVVVGVHYFSDVVGGAVIGFFVGHVLIEHLEKTGLIEKVVKLIKDKLELRRQIAHITTGFAIIFLVHYNLLSLEGLLLILIAGGILSYAMRTKEVPIATNLLKLFEREEYMKRFPGRGSFFFVCGSFLSLLFFSEEIAFAAIAIMAIGDAVNNIIGTYFGRIKIFYNKKKHVEGLVIAIITGTIAGVHFVPLFPAFVAATVALVIETIPLKVGLHEIDDNIVIPLVAGGLLTVML